MAVFYKFKSTKDFFTVPVDQWDISGKDLKAAIMAQRKLGRKDHIELQLIDANTKEEFTDESSIKRNARVIVVRRPSSETSKPRKIQKDGARFASQAAQVSPFSATINLDSLDVSEDKKVAMMIEQSTADYDSSKYSNEQKQFGPVPRYYTCHRCRQPGHWIKDCPLNKGPNRRIRRSSGIPNQFLVPVAGPEVPGALLTPGGFYAVRQAPANSCSPQALPCSAPVNEVPKELLCPLCTKIYEDASVMPCCGSSYCDFCIRSHLLEEDGALCPACSQPGVCPSKLVVHKFLRRTVETYRATGTAQYIAAVKKEPEEEQLVPNADITQTHSQTRKRARSGSESPSRNVKRS